MPTAKYPRSRPTGPPNARELAVPRNNPVPITPPILTMPVNRLATLEIILARIPDHCNMSILKLPNELVFAFMMEFAARSELIDGLGIGRLFAVVLCGGDLFVGHSGKEESIRAAVGWNL